MAVGAERPVSPHLQVYRWHLTMAMSIGHRVSGVGLALGLVLLTWWLTALAGGEASFATIKAVIDNPFGGLILFVYTFVLFFHLCNGVRHLVWDAGYGYDKDVARHSAIVTLGVAAVLTVVAWIGILVVG